MAQAGSPLELMGATEFASVPVSPTPPALQIVNAKKLEKAEARLKAKQTKKQERDSVKSGNPL